LEAPLSTPLGKYVSGDKVKAFASSAYGKSNVAVVASGASSSDLTKWVGEFFTSGSAGSVLSGPGATKYFGGESRIPLGGSTSSIVIAFPGSSAYASGSNAYKPEVSVLATLLGGHSSIKWSPGFNLLSKVAAAHPGVSISTTAPSYSDSGLLAITIEGPATSVAKAAKEAVAALKSVASGDVSKELLTKAVALSKFDTLEASETSEAQLLNTGISLLTGGKTLEVADVVKQVGSVSSQAVSKIAKTLLDGKASVAAVGDISALPWAEELGLKV
jgi:ubiquinol-cytochrome c reductase core subunit 2